MPSRGHWLEAAVELACRNYSLAGRACIQKVPTPAGMTRAGNFYRNRSTIDFIGVYQGLPVAFDAKVTKQSSLPHKNVHSHQVEFLEAFQTAGGFGGLLVCFQSHGTESYMVSATWYLDVIDELGPRKSIPMSRFITGSDRPEEACAIVPHGTSAVPVDFAIALDNLREIC